MYQSIRFQVIIILLMAVEIRMLSYYDIYSNDSGQIRQGIGRRLADEFCWQDNTRSVKELSWTEHLSGQKSGIQLCIQG
ncbi:MAG: hypothetical protein ACLUD0_18135 [Eubacterium ramulus]